MCGYALITHQAGSPFALIHNGIDSRRCWKRLSEVLIHIDVSASHICCRFLSCSTSHRMRPDDCGGHMRTVNSWGNSSVTQKMCTFTLSLQFVLCSRTCVLTKWNKCMFMIVIRAAHVHQASDFNLSQQSAYVWFMKPSDSYSSSIHLCTCDVNLKQTSPACDSPLTAQLRTHWRI